MASTVRTPFTDTNIQKRVINDMVSMIDWTTAPMVSLLGLNGEDKFKLLNWPPGNSKKLEVIEDTMVPRTTTLSAAIGNTTTTTISVTDYTYLRAGHILEIDSEYLWVVTTPTTATVTVTRGYAGTTAATHSNAATINIRGIAKKTGANYTVGPTTTMTLPFNYTQNIEESVQVNTDQEIASDYGVDDTMAYHLAKLIGGNTTVGSKGKAGQLLLFLNDLFYSGKRQQPSDSVAGAAGGVTTFVTTNTTGDTSTDFARTTLESQLRTIWGNGGQPDTIVTSAFGCAQILSWYEGFVETERSEERGGARIKYIVTPEFELEIVRDHMCPNTKTFIIDKSKMAYITARPFTVKEMPALGEYRVNMVSGEYSFIVCNEKSHSIITHKGS